MDLVHLIGTLLPRWSARFYPDLLWRIPTSSKVLYFTFDDGPTPTVTASLLDVLARFEVPATFFLLGQNASRHPSLVRDIAAAGHTVGNHSYSHLDAWRTSERSILAEYERATGVLEDLMQQPIRWLRPPFGRFTVPLRRWCQVRRQRCTMWDVGPGDFLANVQHEQIEARIMRAVRPGSIVVLHDNPRAELITPPALATVLSRLRDDGWRFAAL